MAKPAIPHVDARCRKHPLKKHVSGNKSRPAVPHVDARLRRHTLKEHISGSKSKPGIPHVDARSRKHPIKEVGTEALGRLHGNAWHPPTRRWSNS